MTLRQSLKQQSISDLFFWVLVALPILIFFFVVSRYALNNPYLDDLDAIVASTAEAFDVKNNLFKVWQIIIRQDDERRLIVIRVLSYLVFCISGNLDLRIIAFSGISTYLLLLWLIYDWFKTNPHLPKIAFLPIPFILFTIYNYEAFCGMTMLPVQHIGCYIFAFTSIWFLVKQNRISFFLGIVFAILSIGSDVTGNIILVIGSIVLLVGGRLTQAFIWILVIGTISYYYFNGLVIPEFRPSFKDNIQHWDQLILIFIAMPGVFFDIFPSLLSESHRVQIALIFGVMTLLYLIYLFVPFVKNILNKKKVGRELWLWGCLGFLLATFFAFALGRASEGLESILLSRYKHLYVFWFLFCYLLTIQSKIFLETNKIVKISILIASIVYFSNSYFQSICKIDYQRKVVLTDAFGWYYNRLIPSAPIYMSVKDTVDKMYLKALKVGTYRIPTFPFANIPFLLPQGSTNITIDENSLTVKIHIENIKRDIQPDDGVYVLLKSKNNTIILPTETERNTFKNFLLKATYYTTKHHSIEFNKQFLKIGENYDIRIGVVNENKKYVLKTDKIITVKERIE